MPFFSSSLFVLKKIFIWILVASCLVVVFLLFQTREAVPNYEDVFYLTDSLILQELALFNIDTKSIRTIRYPVTPDFTRKLIIAGLPPQIPKTLFHSALNKQLKTANIHITGYMDVPEEVLTLYVQYENKVIRTIKLHTDNDYVRIPHPASLMIYFDRGPRLSQLKKIRNWGIPAGLVLQVSNPRSINRRVMGLSDIISPVWIWLEEGESGNAEATITKNSELFKAFQKASALHDDLRLFITKRPDQKIQVEEKEDIFFGLPYTRVRKSQIIEPKNRQNFDEIMLSFSQLAQRAGNPTLVVPGNDSSLEWIEEWIPRIQQGAIVFVKP